MMSILWQHNNFDLSHHLTAIKDNEPNLFWMRLKNSFVQILLGPIYFIGTFLPIFWCRDFTTLSCWVVNAVPTQNYCNSGALKVVAKIYDILVNLWHSICRTQTRSFLSILMQKQASFQNFRLEKKKIKIQTSNFYLIWCFLYINGVLLQTASIDRHLGKFR